MKHIAIRALAVFIAVSACTEPKGLLDTWHTEAPYPFELTLNVGGAYFMTSRDGEFWSTTSGVYSLSPDSIRMRASRRVSRLAPYGSMKSEDVSGGLEFHGGLELHGDTLIIRFISAPYDSPEEFTWRFLRGAP